MEDNQNHNPEESLSWTVHPASESPVRSGLTVMLIAMVAGALYQATGTLLYSAITAIALPITLAPFFMPATYTLDKSGVAVRRMGRTRTLKWNQVRTVTYSKANVYVSPHPVKSIRDHRGILILCPNNRAAVVDYIKKVQ